MSALKKTNDVDDEILKDGMVIRVPMMLMDGAVIDPDVYKAHFDAKNAVYDAANHRPRSAVYDADQRAAIDAAYDRYDRRLTQAWRMDAAPHPHLSGLGAAERQSVANMAGTPTGQALAKLTRQSAERMNALANAADERAKRAQHPAIKKLDEEQAAKFRRRAASLEAEAIELETPAKVKDSEQSKLTGFMNAMGAGKIEASFKAGAAVMETSDLAAARKRYHDRLQNSWKGENQ